MKKLRALLVLLLLSVGLVACASGGTGDAGRAPEMADDAGDGAAEAGAAAADEDDREVITTGSLTLVVEDALGAVEDVVALVGETGGRVDERSQQAGSENDPARAWLTLRVPAGELDPLVAELEEVGDVSEVSISAEDVTGEARDLDARISALEASTERLIGLMAEADSSEALLAAESALSERQADLEALQSQRNRLSDQVAMSTLRVSIVSDEEAPSESTGFVGGMQSGWNALVDFLAGLLVGLGTALPWLVVLAVPVLAVVWLWRRRRRRKAALAASAMPPAPPAPRPAGDHA